MTHNENFHPSTRGVYPPKEGSFSMTFLTIVMLSLFTDASHRFISWMTSNLFVNMS